MADSPAEKVQHLTNMLRGKRHASGKALPLGKSRPDTAAIGQVLRSLRQLLPHAGPESLACRLLDHSSSGARMGDDDASRLALHLYFA
jgi:hypothetical protein